ncbi:citramalate synthase [Palleronia abyssalis]|uniref:Citramalate synthase n=1 Tax=Palleronia abyssalis TaxID=1501240 RepID=A0A2R8C0I6_9RHOB|nr:citramalate synthase [Palleronia abyssalis]SPJ25903.1 (R)-citramalate synthase [Palleronia abyssalis]
MTERLYLYDTTLRDGQQTQGVQFSVEEKKTITAMLDTLGVDYIEGGWPGANPTDSAFFDTVAPTRATMTAFGMTKRAGRSAANDDVLAAVLNARTPSVCLVGKTHDYHVATALGITNDENLENIHASLSHIVAEGREALFDAEHFFDGYASDRDYALSCLHAAFDAGARWIVLCDTNGGTLPGRIADIVSEVIASGIPGDRLGIHTHDDTSMAVAGSLAAVEAGVRQIQGTLNGLGERCGNADLVSIIPTLALKEPYASRFDIGVDEAGLQSLTRVSNRLDDLLNRVPRPNAPYVGSSAFAHKAGLHASAIAKDPATYEHIAPSAVGNRRVIPMSNQAGQSNLRARLLDMGLKVEMGDPRLSQILQEIKEWEDAGYSFDEAQASFELIARRVLGQLPGFFVVDWYRAIIAHRAGTGGVDHSSEASLQVRIGERVELSHAFGGQILGKDSGPVDALHRALKAALVPYADAMADMHLVDFRVRISGQGTEAVTKVIMKSADGQGRNWSSVGVSANIIEASFEALVDAVNWKLIRDAVPA